MLRLSVVLFTTLCLLLGPVKAQGINPVTPATNDLIQITKPAFANPSNLYTTPPLLGSVGFLIISGITPCTGCTNGDLLGVAGGKVADVGWGAIYSASNTNFFLGPSAGNVSAAGQGNTAIGILAGNALTVPSGGAGSQPQAGTFVGYQAGALVTTARENTFIGWMAGSVFTGNGQGIEDGTSTFVGSQAGLNTTGTGASSTDNTYIGQKAGLGNITGGFNTDVGAHAGFGMVSSQNVAIGQAAGGFASTSGNGHVFVGVNAGLYVQGSAVSNTYVGGGAGQSSVGNPGTGSNNTGVGNAVLQGLTSGAQNTAIGQQAAIGITTAQNNVIAGFTAATPLTTGSNNVLIGANAGSRASFNGNDNIFIGYQAGSTAPTNSLGIFIAGDQAAGNAAAITNVFFGNGYAATTPVGYTVNGTGGSGTDITGGDINIAGGKGTGAGIGGKVHIQTALHSTTGTTLNTLADALVVDETKLVTLPAITSDAALTDTTVCQDTTNHGLRAGSGTAGICLGNVSSIRFKDAWTPLDDGLSVIMALNPGTWRYKPGVVDSGAKLQVGFLAEDYAHILPDWTRYDDQGRPNGVDLLAVLPQTVRAIQQLKADNDNLRADVEQLRRRSIR